MTSTIIKKIRWVKMMNNSDWWYRSLKNGKLGSKTNDDNIGKEYDDRNRMDMSDDKYSDERYQIDKTNE